MTEKAKNLIKEEMLKLPKETQEAISAFDWEKISEEIGKKYLLSAEEINTFQLETICFLLGLVDENLYPLNLEEEVGISKDEANKIADEVFQKIFIPITDILLENIKKSDKNKNANAEQNLNFILSGGDYSSFLAPNSPLEEYSDLRSEGGGESTPSFSHPSRGESATPPSKRATPQEGNNIPIKPPKTTDINPAVRLSKESSTTG